MHDLECDRISSPCCAPLSESFLSQTNYTQPATKVATVIGAASPDILGCCKSRFKLLKLCNKNIVQLVIGLIRLWQIIVGTTQTEGETWAAGYQHVSVSALQHTLTDLAQIPTIVSSVTFLAAATSIPDAVSSMAVARKGLGPPAECCTDTADIAVTDAKRMPSDWPRATVRTSWYGS